MKNVSNPIIIDQYYCDSNLPCANQVRYGLRSNSFIFEPERRAWLCHFLKPSVRFRSTNNLLFLRLQTSALKVEGISFIHIKGTTATKEAIKFSCSDTSSCEGLFLKDILLLPNNDGEISTSFCWQAYGSSSGPVYPSPCLLRNKNFIEQKVQSDPAPHSF